MNKKLITILLLITILSVSISGCISESTETIIISGIDQEITISSDKQVRLIVSGIDNIIIVPLDVTIIEIRLSGIENTVYIPKSINPKVVMSGIDNVIIRY